MKIEDNLISSIEVAELLNVSKAAISQAVRTGHKCKGYEVAQYAVKDEGGRVKGFEPELIEFITNVRKNPLQEPLKTTSSAQKNGVDESTNSKKVFSEIKNRFAEARKGDFTPPKGVVYQDNSIRLLDDKGAKNVGHAFMGASAIQIVPNAIEKISKLQEHQQDAFYASIMALGFSALGYFVGGDNKTWSAIGFGAIGLGVYATAKYQNKRTLTEDRAMMGINPSADQRTGDPLTAEKSEGVFSNIYPLKAVTTPV